MPVVSSGKMNISESDSFLDSFQLDGEWNDSLAPSGNNSAEIHYNERSLAVKVLVASSLILITLVTLIGNTLVCLAPMVNRKLRTTTNFLLVSLGFADLCLGVTVLPFSLTYEVQREWMLGAAFCNVYTALDVMLCSASVLSIFLICVERYVAISRPLEYAKWTQNAKKKVGLAIGAVWLVSLIISFFPIHFGWNTVDGRVQNYDNPTRCFLASNAIFSLVDGVLLFFIPLALMIAMYLRILYIARSQAREINRTNAVNARIKTESAERRTNIIDEHKATKVIATILGIFIICWVPYFTVFTFCPLTSCRISEDFYQVILWMGYSNSLLNPCLYSVLNKEFRSAFKILLCTGTCKSACIFSMRKGNNRPLIVRRRYVGKVRCHSTPNTMPTATGMSNKNVNK